MSPGTTDRKERAPKASVKIAQSIRREILSGGLLPGDPLPPERDLARRHGMHRGAVREAMSLLQQTRFIRSTPRGRTRVLDIWREGSLDMLEPLFDPACLPEDPAPLLRELLTVRRFCTAALAEGAAALAGGAEIDRLTAAAGGAPDPTKEPEACLSHDLAFMEALADASHATVHRWIWNVLRSVLERLDPLLLRQVCNGMDSRFHCDLAEAVSHRDGAAAVAVALERGPAGDGEAKAEWRHEGEEGPRPRAASRSKAASRERKGETAPEPPPSSKKEAVPHSPLTHFVWMRKGGM